MSRRGFTLFEVLLVSAILVAMAGFAWPIMRQGLENQKLRSTAQRLQGRIAATRAAAINAGETHVLRYNVGEAIYQVGPLCQTAAEPDGAAPQGFGVTQQESAPAVPAAMKEEKLPERIHFLAPSSTSSDGAGQRAALQIAGFNREAPGESAGAIEIHFQPDGACDTTTVRLGSESGRTITVQVRGMTSQTVLGGIEMGEE